MDYNSKNQPYNHGDPSAGGGGSAATSNSNNPSNNHNPGGNRPRTLRSQSEEAGSGDGSRASRRKSSAGRPRKGVTFNNNPTAADVAPPVGPGNGLCAAAGSSGGGGGGGGGDGFSDVLEANGTDDDAFRPNNVMCLNGDLSNQPQQGILHTINEGASKRGRRRIGNAAGQVPFNSDQYNDFVNELYTESESERPLLPAAPKQGRTGSAAAGSSSSGKRFPKSIVKSTSAANIQGQGRGDGQAEAAATEGKSYNSKPRLSLQVPSKGGRESVSNDGRPLCSKPHVQFEADKRWKDEFGTEDGEAKSPHLAEGKSNSFESFTGSAASASSSSSGTSSSSSSSSSSSEDNSSMDRFAEARPPDGGWGWVVVFAAFMVNLFSDGVTFSFGVIYVEFLDYFGEGKAKTAWIGSLFMAMPLLSGPIASFLTDRYGCRNVTVVGSIMASSGFILSAFTDSIEMLYFTFGILAGFGLSLCYVAAVVIVAYYFEKRRSFATGLSLCGSGIGTFIFAPLTQVLIEEYGWRGSILILAGIFLNMGVCGLLMRDLEWTTLRRKKISNQRKEEKARKKAMRKNEKGGSSRNTASDTLSISTNTAVGGNGWNQAATAASEDGAGGPLMDDEEEGDPRLFSSLIVLPTFLKDGEKVPHEVLESLSTNRHILMMSNYATMPIPSFRASGDHAKQGEARQEETPTTTDASTNTTGNGDLKKALVPTANERMLMNIIERNQRRRHHKDQRIRSASSALTTKPTTAYLNDMRMHRHSLTYRGAMLNINRYRLRASSCPDIYRNSMTTIAKEKSQLSQGIEEFRNLLCNILDFSHFTDIRFVLFAISNCLLYAWYDVPYVYIADYAISFGVSQKMASMLLSIVGIINMFGEIILGWLGDKKINVTILYAFCMILCGVIVFMVPSFITFEAMGVLSGLFGFFIAANYSLTSIILVQLITIERFTNAYGLLLLVQGVANLIGPPLAGYMRDVTGDYDLSFYAAGVFIVLSGILLMVLPGVDKYKKYKALSQRPNDLTILENGGVKGDNKTAQQADTEAEKRRLGCV